VSTVASLSLIDVTSGTDAVWPEIALTMTSLIVGATLVVALRASGLRRRLQHVAVAFVLFASALSVVMLIIDLAADVNLSVYRSDRPSPIWVLIALLSPIAVIRRLTRHRRVTAQTLLGAIAAYLLIAVGFTYLYMFVGSIQDAPFFASYTSDADIPSTSYMYFSMVTITTLGYGDLSPAPNFSRLLATTEAVIGQVYLVTFVAMVVGIFIQQRDSDRTVPEP
jgi:uncharacterized membrane protein